MLRADSTTRSPRRLSSGPVALVALYAGWVTLALLSASGVEAQTAAAVAPASVPEPEQVEVPDAQYRAVATATRVPRTPRQLSASVSLLSADDIAHSPSLMTDALLGSLPSFATFRRSSSLAADPSSQGVNLRALGPSGVSRALVLVDGVPANDPFGGFVYFRALPRLGLERIEVVPSGASALYGSAALGGVVELSSRRITSTQAQGEAAYGSFGTVQLGLRTAQRLSHGGAALEAHLLTSEGYPVVAPEQRGPIDGAAPSIHGALHGTIELEPTERLTFRTALSLFSEDQRGGTRFTTAGATLSRFVLGARYDMRAAGQLELTVFGGAQRFEQQRARVAPGRGSEELAARQDVPSLDGGASLLWRSQSLSLAGRHLLVTGADARAVRGTAREQLFPPMLTDASMVRRDAGGQQWLAGAFFEDIYEPTSWLQLDAALRLDRVFNSHGKRLRERASGERQVERFDASSDTALSPRLGVLVRPHSMLRLRGSVYRAFRAPTLGELYRPFQVGTILTAANEQLRPERLLGAEAGVELEPVKPVLLRATAFINHLDDPVTNRTLPEPLPDGSMRQRQNLGAARTRGVELEVGVRWTSRFSARLSYTLVEALVTEADLAPQLLHKHLVQAPVHRAGALISFDDPALLTAALQVRAVSSQYEDDLNTLRIPAYAVVDVLFARRLIAELEVFAAAENLLNTRYVVGRAGVDTIGAPLLLRAGLRLRGG